MRRPRIPPRSSYEHLIFQPGEAPELPPAPSSGPDVEDAGDHLIIRNIECVDADGNPFERHDEIWMPKDVVRTDEIDEHGNKTPKWFTPYNAIRHFDDLGDDWSLPPVPVTLNSLLKVFVAAVEKQPDGKYNTLDEEAKKVLDRYLSKGPGYTGIHRQNTLISYGSCEIIHYPGKGDFQRSGGSTDINSGIDSIRLSFDKSELYDCLLSDGIKESGIERFARQFTGVADLEKLVELGEYYDKPTNMWFPLGRKGDKKCDVTSATWVGCGSSFFSLYSGNYLDNYRDAASGVQKNA